MTAPALASPLAGPVTTPLPTPLDPDALLDPAPATSLPAVELTAPHPSSSSRWTPAFPAPSQLLAASAGTKIILILGRDARPGAPGRSDSMVPAAVTAATGSVRLFNLPRDTWAYIPGVGWGKWSHAYAFGRESLSVQTMQRFLGIRIDYTATFSCVGFHRVVDAVGGIGVVVDHDLDYDDP